MSDPKLPRLPDAGEAVARFVRHLEARAGRYFPELAADHPTVRLVWRSVRLNSQLYEFAITGKAATRRVIVKVPFAPKHVAGSVHHDRRPAPDRPRLFPKADAYAKGLYEYRALGAIDAHFRGLCDRRFGTIRVFDLLPDPYTVVMEKATDPALARLVRKAHRGLRSSQWKLLEEGFRHAGAWLDQMHRLEPLEHTQPRNRRADDYFTATDRFIAFLKRCGGERGFFDRFPRELTEAAAALLPETLPLGTSHGDYAPRNLLLQRGGRVTVFDTLARWQAPIYEDVAHFLVALKTSMPQVLAPRLLSDPARLAACEEAFLQAYFERTGIPRGVIRLFECQVLLERWTALVFRAEEAGGLRGVARRARVLLLKGGVTRHLASALRQAICEAEGDAATVPRLFTSP